MAPKFSSRWMLFLILLLLFSIACSTSVAISTPPEAEPTATQETPTVAVTEATETSPPVATDTVTARTPTEEIIQETTPNTPEPTCTVRSQTLNLRSGPSQLYRPPIRELPANSVVVPLGYLPTGLIQGPWAYVEDQATLLKGWVSAEPNFITCTIDLASLPPVDYDPPPPYTPVSDTSPGPGTCGDIQVSQDDGAEYNCDVVYANGFPVQFIVYKDGQQAGRDDGVQNVTFRVDDENGNTIYTITENNEAYCVFGGNAPCPSWTLDDYLYHWGANGPLLESGTYTLSITPTLDDPTVNLFWSADITVTLPF